MSDLDNINSSFEKKIKSVKSIKVVENKGIVGDRHFHDYNDPYNQITLIESENIDEYNLENKLLQFSK